jgi:hypothetical protein
VESRGHWARRRVLGDTLIIVGRQFKFQKPHDTLSRECGLGTVVLLVVLMLVQVRRGDVQQRVAP